MQPEHALGAGPVHRTRILPPRSSHPSGGYIMARTDGSSGTGKGHAKVKQGTPGGAGGQGQSGTDAGKTKNKKGDKSGYGSTGSKSSGGAGSSQSSGGGHGGTH